MSLICLRKQLPESSGNSKTTLEKGGRNPPDVKLDFVLENLFNYFNELEILCETKKEIEKKYDINEEHDDCWAEDDIKRAWGKTQRIDKNLKRNRWALVTVLQALKRQRTKEEESDLNEGRDVVQRCAELRLSDTPDQMKAKRENGTLEDDLWSTDDTNQACGKAESVKVNSKERSTQSNDELKTVGAAGGVKQSPGGNPPTSSYLWQTGIDSKVWTGMPIPFQGSNQATGNSAPRGQFRTLESEKNMYSEDENIYIRIPLREMFHYDPTDRGHLVQYVPSRYKLIHGFPSDNDVNITTSYAMSFNNDTGNAEWVYEILNGNTLVNNFQQRSFGHGYVRGHLAAAANHRWCREAYNDTYLFSNIIPQNHLLNIRTWKDLENYCRNMTRDNEIRNVHVYTGPIYIRPMDYFELEGKQVPSDLFKVIIVENVNGTVREPECYVMPNVAPQTNDLNVYRRNIGELQTVSRLTFIEHRPNLRDRDEIITGTLRGQDLNQTPCDANIGARITSNVNW